MTLSELTKDQKIKLKQDYLTNKKPNVSYGELADADELVSDAELEAEYGDVSFTTDDFGS